MNTERPENLTLGCVAKDRISGFSGVVIAITQWLNGCQRVTIQPQRLKDDGSTIGNETFDAEQVEVVEPAEPAVKKPKGGPSITPTRAIDPK